MAGSIKNGRKNPSGQFINTLKRKSAEQGMLIKMDSMIDRLNQMGQTVLAAGSATLVAGAVTVSNSLVTANSIILLTVQTAGGTQGFLRVSSLTPGSGFGIASSSATETSVVGWAIVDSSGAALQKLPLVDGQ